MNKKNYELIAIFAPELTKENLDVEVKKLEKLLSDKKAEAISVEHWGVRTMTCTMKKRTTAQYVVFHFDTENTELTTEMTAALRINETVLKFQFHLSSEKKRAFKGNPLKLKEKTVEAVATA